MLESDHLEETELVVDLGRRGRITQKALEWVRGDTETALDMEWIRITVGYQDHGWLSRTMRVMGGV